jgi:2-polyprenyl-3-methyl-5-hydroxy-6-metoxy-1,4-benzoquinol methylase
MNPTSMNTPAINPTTMDSAYLMDSAAETQRLELKTDALAVERQARAAGLLPGMRVADIACGPGKTSATLAGIVGGTGTVTGFDASEERIAHARLTYGAPNLDFVRHDLRQAINAVQPFDFVWVRFLLEYHRAGAFDIVERCAGLLKPGGILCLVDLDHNSLSHYGIPTRLETALRHAMTVLEEQADFDPYAGRKLYSHLYRLGFTNIKAALEAHHLIYGPLSTQDELNWFTKLEVIPRKIQASLPGYASLQDFQDDFRRFFSDPGRFSYTPLIACWGQKPAP